MASAALAASNRGGPSPMQWRERDQRLEAAQRRIVDAHRTREARAAMHDAVPGGDHAMLAAVCLLQPREHELDGAGLRQLGGVGPRALGDDAIARVQRAKPRGAAGR